MYLNEKQIERFWFNVQKSEHCWHWMGYIDPSGQGKQNINKIPQRAHRIAWILIHGSIPENMSVYHNCRHANCVNPDHLFLRNRHADKTDPCAITSRLLSYINIGDGCWEWIGQKWQSGYGRLIVNGKLIQASRLIYRLFIGDIADELCICHRCDNPLCVRPAHLFAGTNQENSYDRHKKGRDAKGENHGKAKLTVNQVIAIRQRFASGVSKNQLARDYNVSHPAIRHAISRRTWQHVK